MTAEAMQQHAGRQLAVRVYLAGVPWGDAPPWIFQHDRRLNEHLVVADARPNPYYGAMDVELRVLAPDGGAIRTAAEALAHAHQVVQEIPGIEDVRGVQLEAVWE